MIVVLLSVIQEAVIDSPLDMILEQTLLTKIILGVLVIFSLVSWALIIWKFQTFRNVDSEADSFVFAMEQARDLTEARSALRALSDSPCARLFREGMLFYQELRPGAFDEEKPRRGLSPTQLDALWLVLEKNLSQERDELSQGLQWLAVIGSVSPLLGLMGTVVGIMNSFIGITAQGSANIAAVAPGIAGALATTVAGLAVAIPAVIAYNSYAARLKLFVGELEGFASEFVGTLAREGRL